MTAEILIEPGDLDRPDLQALLAEHLADMHTHSPACSVHALDVDGLRRPGVSVWVAMGEGSVVGCAALQQLDDSHGEIKSMRVGDRMRGAGVGTRLLRHLIEEARHRGCARLSLETGSQEAFAPARRLYARHGFTECGPFAGYHPDRASVFMTLGLDPGSG